MNDLRRLGHEVRFATPDGTPARADPRMLHGDGLGPWRHLLRADANGRAAHDAMVFSHGAMWAGLLFAAVLGMRYLMAIGAGGIALGDQFLMRDLWLLPLRDAMSMVVWVASYFGKTVVWRGERFTLNKGEISPASPS